MTEAFRSFTGVKISPIVSISSLELGDTNKLHFGVDNRCNFGISEFKYMCLASDLPCKDNG